MHNFIKRPIFTNSHKFVTHTKVSLYGIHVHVCVMTFTKIDDYMCVLLNFLKFSLRPHLIW